MKDEEYEGNQTDGQFHFKPFYQFDTEFWKKHTRVAFADRSLRFRYSDILVLDSACGVDTVNSCMDGIYSHGSQIRKWADSASWKQKSLFRKGYRSLYKR